MRVTTFSTFLLFAASAPAFADHPHCTITEIRPAGDAGDATKTAIDVPNVYAKGQRWAEYNCRQDSRALASTWLADHGGCAAGHVAFKYKLALGETGSEKAIDITYSCPKGGASTSGSSTTSSSDGYHVGDKLSVEWHGKYYPASVVRVEASGRYFIHYDGFASKWDETVGPSRIAGASSAASSSPPPSSAASSGTDPVKCVLVRVKERDLGEKSVSPTVEIDWLKGQKYPDKIPASSQEILCKTQAMTPAIEWAKANGLCGMNVKYVVQLGRVSNPISIEGGAICNPHKALGH